MNLFGRAVLLPTILINMSNEKKLRVQVQFWGSWGYVKYYEDLKDFLVKEIGDDKIEMIPVKDSTTTGNFEVTVPGEETLYSRKQLGGWQKMLTTAEKMVIMDQVQELLE